MAPLTPQLKHPSPPPPHPNLPDTPPPTDPSFYGPTTPKLLVMLRDPTRRLRHAFFSHGHYTKRHGAHAEGFDAYAREQARPEL